MVNTRRFSENIECCELNKNGYKINTSHRKGGGLAKIHRDNIKVKRTESKELNTFQLANWNCVIRNISFNVMYL